MKRNRVIGSTPGWRAAGIAGLFIRTVRRPTIDAVLREYDDGHGIRLCCLKAAPNCGSPKRCPHVVGAMSGGSDRSAMGIVDARTQSHFARGSSPQAQLTLGVA